MTFVCLGWGSLIWDEERAPELPTRGPWRSDGPHLPIEFARKSVGHRLTLVITPGAKRVPVLWAELEVSSFDEAINALANREGRKGGGPTRQENIGRWPSGHNFPETEVIAEWESTKGFNGVVWTALRPNFQDCQQNVPQLSDVLEYIMGLTGPEARVAKRYILKTPAQIETGFRAAIERALDPSDG